MEPQDEALLKMLFSLPEKWAEYKWDDFTDTEQKVLKRIVAAGLVEEKIWLHCKMEGFKEEVQFQVYRRGDYTQGQLKEAIIKAMPEKWLDTKGRTRGKYDCKRQNSFQARLTDEGALAKHDYENEKPSFVLHLAKRVSELGVIRICAESKRVIENDQIRVKPKRIKPNLPKLRRDKCHAEEAINEQIKKGKKLAKIPLSGIDALVFSVRDLEDRKTKFLNWLDSTVEILKLQFENDSTANEFLEKTRPEDFLNPKILTKAIKEFISIVDNAICELEDILRELGLIPDDVKKKPTNRPSFKKVCTYVSAVLTFLGVILAIIVYFDSIINIWNRRKTSVNASKIEKIARKRIEIPIKIQSTWDMYTNLHRQVDFYIVRTQSPTTQKNIFPGSAKIEIPKNTITINGMISIPPHKTLRTKVVLPKDPKLHEYLDEGGYIIKIDLSYEYGRDFTLREQCLFDKEMIKRGLTYWFRFPE